MHTRAVQDYLKIIYKLSRDGAPATDLNLLVLFEAVLAERHVGRAADKLNLTASAVSHGLGRLRKLLNDPLFLRTPKGVVPTARAIESSVPSPPRTTMRSTCEGSSHFVATFTAPFGTTAAVSFSTTTPRPRAESQSRSRATTAGDAPALATTPIRVTPFLRCCG